MRPYYYQDLNNSAILVKSCGYRRRRFRLKKLEELKMPGTATKKSMWPATSQQLKRMPRHIYYSLGTSAQTTLPIETNLLMSKTFAHSSLHQYGPDAVVGAFCGAPTAMTNHHGCVQLEPMECFVLWNEARTRRITPCCRLNRTGPGPLGSHSSSFMTSLKVGQLHDLLNLGRVRSSHRSGGRGGERVVVSK